MSGVLIEDDYLDPDVAYLLGMIVARGEIIEQTGTYSILIDFPFQNLEVMVEDLQGNERAFDVAHFITLGLTGIRERVLELLNGDVSIIATDHSRQMRIRLMRKTIGWRDIILQLQNRTSHRSMMVPPMLFHPDVSTDICMEFIRGYADVAGNIRRANRYVDGRHRVRLDVLNDNWQLPVDLCRLLQQKLNIPVQMITWGHPNLGRGFREHQLNIFAVPFERVGFSFEHKRALLQMLVAEDSNKNDSYNACPGRKAIRAVKPADPDETSARLPAQVRAHFNSYWQICKALGCKVEPPPGPLFADADDDEELN